MPDRKKRATENPKPGSGNSTMRALLTQERAQKLDLLVHLLTNLRQPLVVCGPEGIGKTTLLNTLQETRGDQWWMFSQPGSINLSFEAIITNLNRFLNLSDTSYGFDLTALRHFCAKQKLILIIDDAGVLVPGLISELIELADSMAGLQLIFSMTYDQFHIKHASDKSIDDCHFIELPPLNLRQCRDFLQNLSAQPATQLAFQSVTDELVADLYRDTHGIPGKILQTIPKLTRYQKHKPGRLGLWAGIVLITLCAVAAVKLYMPLSVITTAQEVIESKLSGEISKTPLNLPKFTQPEAIIPVTPPQEPELNTEKTVIPLITLPSEPPLSTVNTTPENKAPLLNEAASSAGKTQSSEQIPKPTEVTPSPIPVTPPAVVPETNLTSAEKKLGKPEKVTDETESLEWINAQPASNFTLQIMVLSNKLAVTRFIKHYAEYSDDLKYYTINKNNQEKYVLIYGSFKTANEAKEYKDTMPEEFKRALEKRFRVVQTESRP